jgi:hypothetical protein
MVRPASLTCRVCGPVSDYEVKPNGPHQEARCTRCHSYIKHLPRERNHPPLEQVDLTSERIFFGIHRDKSIAEISAIDPKYVRWLSREAHSEWVRQLADLAIEEFGL